MELDYKIEGIILSQTIRPKSRSNFRLSPMEEFATNNAISLIYPSSSKDLEDTIKKYNVNMALLAAYGKIIPDSILELFKEGIINIHPSLLPLHRGPTPIESVILNGDSETGVSIIKLVSKMDAGPIYVQRKINVDPKISKQNLVNELSKLASTMLSEHLEDIVEHKLLPETQKDQFATYDNLISKENSILNPTKPANILEKEVRAYLNWPKSKIKLASLDLIITKSHVKSGSAQIGEMYINDQEIGIYTSKNILVFDKIQPVSKKELEPIEFINGYKDHLMK